MSAWFLWTCIFLHTDPQLHASITALMFAICKPTSYEVESSLKVFLFAI